MINLLYNRYLDYYLQRAPRSVLDSRDYRIVEALKEPPHDNVTKKLERIVNLNGKAYLLSLGKKLIKENSGPDQIAKIKMYLEMVELMELPMSDVRANHLFESDDLVNDLDLYFACGGGLGAIMKKFQHDFEASQDDEIKLKTAEKFALCIHKYKDFIDGKSNSRPSLWQRISFFAENFFLIRLFRDSAIIRANKAIDKAISTLDQDTKSQALNTAVVDSGYVKLPFISVLWKNKALVNDSNRAKLFSEACALGNYEMVKQLVENGYDVKELDNEFPNKSVIGDSCVNDPNPDLLKFLIDKGADPNKLAWQHPNCSNLHLLACNYDNPEALRVLLSHGHVNPNHLNREKSGDSPLHIAAFHLNARNVKVLIEFGAEVNIQNQKDETPLHLLCERSSPGNGKLFRFIFNSLVSKGADLTLKNKKNLTPLQCAIEAKNLNILNHAFQKDHLLRLELAKGISEFVNFIQEMEADPTKLIKGVGKARALQIAEILNNQTLIKKLNPVA